MVGAHEPAGGESQRQTGGRRAGAKWMLVLEATELKRLAR